MRHPENLVSYQTPLAERGRAQLRLDALGTAATGTQTAAIARNFTTRRRLLSWQVRLERADADFAARRYEEALAGYEQVSAGVLALIEPKVATAPPPKRWPEGRPVTEAVAGAGAALLSYLLPEEVERPLVLVAPVEVGVDNGGRRRAIVATASALTPEATTLTERASTAVRHGQWTEAAELYGSALALVPEDQPERAELLLNLGAVEVQRGRTAEARTHLERAHALFKTSGDELGMAEATHNAALALLRGGDGTGAVARLKEARVLAGRASLRGLLDVPAGAPAPGRPATAAAAEQMTSVMSVAPAGVEASAPATVRAVARVGPEPVAAAGAGTIGRAPTRTTDIDDLAEAVGSADLALKLRPIGTGAGRGGIKLQTPAQERAEDLPRTVRLAVADEPIDLTWSTRKPVQADALLSGLSRRVAATLPDRVGLVDRTEAALAAALPHLYHLVLPIKMGDCLHQLQRFEAAHEQYARASRYEMINVALEAPDLWRRLAENVAAWGDSRYRSGDGQAALPVYELLVRADSTPPESILYTAASLAPTGTLVRAWLEAVRADQQPPQLNPAIAATLQLVRERWVYLNAGLDFFGAPATMVSPFTFRHLQDAARYLAQRASQAEQRYIEFYARFESGQLTRKDLEDAAELADLGVDLARQNQRAAQAGVRAAQAATALADLRHRNAQDQLAQFNDAAWELEQLAGHIARGSAWTGGDLPNLHYSAEGRYDIEGRKHEVLQELTRRQTRIGNNLQRSRLADAVEELNQARAVAGAQQAVAQARAEAAAIETRLAQTRAAHTADMLDAFNDQLFNPEQWLAMALFMRRLANTALDRAIEVAQLMERAYNFENVDQRAVIRPSYKVSSTRDMLGAEWLLSDIDSFTHHHVTQVRDKPIPVKWALSLAEEFPGAFLELTRTGRMDFEVDLGRVALAHPGTYRHRLVGVELEVDGFLPPTGLHGRLTSSGLGRHRSRDGEVGVRLQPAETLVLSRYNRRLDSAVLIPSTDMRALFEGNSVGCGWTLEIPRSANDLDLRLVFDIRLVMYFDCRFDRDLYERDAAPPPETVLDRSRAVYLAQHQPDAFYQLRESGRASIELTAADFPLNQASPVLTGLSLGMVAAAGSAPLASTELVVTHPGTAGQVTVTVADGDVVPPSALPVTGTPPATGRYEITLADRRNDVDDLVLVIDYRYTPA